MCTPLHSPCCYSSICFCPFLLTSEEISLNLAQFGPGKPSWSFSCRQRSKFTVEPCCCFIRKIQRKIWNPTSTLEFARFVAGWAAQDVSCLALSKSWDWLQPSVTLSSISGFDNGWMDVNGRSLTIHPSSAVLLEILAEGNDDFWLGWQFCCPLRTGGLIKLDNFLEVLSSLMEYFPEVKYKTLMKCIRSELYIQVEQVNTKHRANCAIILCILFKSDITERFFNTISHFAIVPKSVVFLTATGCRGRCNKRLFWQWANNSSLWLPHSYPDKQRNSAWMIRLPSDGDIWFC